MNFVLKDFAVFRSPLTKRTTADYSERPPLVRWYDNTKSRRSTFLQQATSRDAKIRIRDLELLDHNAFCRVLSPGALISQF